MATVLVVEDDADSMVLICTVMSEAGHKVLRAVDGPGALDTARKWAPDAVVLDVSLAGSLTGLDVCRAIRADPKLTDIPVIMVSGWAFDSDIEAGKDAGADAYLAKPFRPVDLQVIVMTQLEIAARKTASSS